MKISMVFMFFISAVMYSAAQEIQTAVAFFDEVADRYNVIDDYSISITINLDDTISSGMLYYQKPDKLRIDFDEPEGQVMVSNGDVLQVYVPQFNVVLQQGLADESTNLQIPVTTDNALRLLRKNYSIAYLDNPVPVPLEENSRELVTKLQLIWRNTNEGYRQLILSISADYLIRRVEGIAADYREIQFDFEDIRLNRGLPEARFEYEAPSSANLLNNFLFGEDN